MYYLVPCVCKRSALASSWPASSARSTAKVHGPSIISVNCRIENGRRAAVACKFNVRMLKIGYSIAKLSVNEAKTSAPSSAVATT